MSDSSTALKKKVVGRLVFFFFFLSLSFRLFLHATPSHWLEPVLFKIDFDFTYWLFMLSGLPDIIIQNKIGSILFDIFLLLTAFLCIILPDKNLICILFGCLFFIYALSYNTYIVHHAHPLTIMTLASTPFFFRNDRVWNFLWEGFRYYVCYIYTMSFFWKSFIGKSLLFWNMGINSFEQNLVEYIFYYPDTMISSFYKFLIVHPFILNVGAITIFLLEGFMVVGFFTKKLDRVLFFIPILIHVATYFFSDVFFMEMLVGIFAFLSFEKVKKIVQHFPLIAY